MSNETLTVENAKTASTVICKSNPEWGTKRFNHNEQPLSEGCGFASTVGSGCNSAVLHEGEYKFWEIASYKRKTVIVKLPNTTIVCPSCKAEIDLDDEQLDINVTCTCGQELWTETEE